MRHARLPRTTVLCLALAMSLAGSVALADGADASARSLPSLGASPTDSEVRDYVAAFDDAFEAAKTTAPGRSRAPSPRRESAGTDDAEVEDDGPAAALVERFAVVSHARVGSRLLELACDDDTPGDAAEAAFRLLAKQPDAVKKLVPKVVRWLGATSKAAADALAKGDIGVPIDRRTGEPVPDNAERRKAIAAGERTARAVTGALALLIDIDVRPKEIVGLLRPFLQSPHDRLAEATLTVMEAWKLDDLARELLDLFHMYPRSNRWETGAVVHISGTNASAKAAWMTLFGHPLKQRARPAVYARIVSCASSFAGAKVETPEDFQAWLRGRTSEGRKRR